MRMLLAFLVVALTATVAGCASGAPGNSSGTSASSSGTPAEESGLAVSGDLGAHDPALVAGENGDPWYVFSTGGTAGDGTIEVRRSADGKAWESLGTIWDTKPAWIAEAVPGVSNLWAPELFRHDGTWYLYYAASTFGSNRSVIGLATNTTLDPDAAGYQWVDRGMVVESQTTDDFNAIDPGIIDDADGTPWLAFGSFWSGIRMVQLTWPTGMRADASVPARLADRQTPPNAIEAAYIVSRDGYYYLFSSRDFCCKALDSTYNVAVGRSKDVGGPYVDRKGVALLADGGTPVLTSHGSVVGPGGQSVSNGYIAFHYYDGDAAGQTRLAIQKLEWKDGWPTVG